MNTLQEGQQNQPFGPWENAGIYDTVIGEFLKNKVLKENNSIFFFEIFCLIVSLAALFSSLLFWPVFITVLLTVVTGVMVYLVRENNQERKLINKLLDQKKYQICSVNAYEIFPERAATKCCYVKDKNGNIFTDENDTSKPKVLTYHWYFSHKETAGVLVRMRKGTKGMYYIVLPLNYLQQDTKH